MRMRMRQGGGRGTRPGGFTLIELLVVVAIIAILMGLLLVALKGARDSANQTKTQALLTGLAENIAAYQMDFGAYPGPVLETTVAAGSGVMTGTQNMYLGLSRRWATTAAPLAVAAGGSGAYATLTVGSSTLYVDNSLTAAPYDSSNGRGFKSYYTPKNNELYPTNGTAYPGVTSTLPMIVDAYPDALPILYYRKTTGVDVMPTAFNQNVNAPLTNPGSGTIKAASGILFAQGLASADLTTMLSNPTGGPAGGFVLIAAGKSRHYGPVTAGAGHDNIIVPGGQ